MNPGWQQPDDLHPLEPALTRDPDVGLTDLIVKNKIFNFFLYLGCVPLTEEHDLMSRMMTDEEYKQINMILFIDIYVCIFPTIVRTAT